MSRAGFIAAWAVATLVATLLAFAAVSFVAGDLRSGPQVLGTIAAPVLASTLPDTVPATVSTAQPPASTVVEVESSESATPPSTIGSTPTTSSPTTTKPSPTTTSTIAIAAGSDSRVVSSIGGSAGISCAGDVISLDWYTPSQGFSPDLEHAGPGEVELKFEDEKKWESHIHADCKDGKVVPFVEEHDESG